MTFLAIALALLLAACGDVNTDNPPDASDVSGDDLPSDLSTDTPPDTTVDPFPDAEPDPEPDVTTDPTPDPLPDTEEPSPDLEPEPTIDLPEDWPRDLPGEWPYTTHPQCIGVGGFCSGGFSLLCPWGYEPSGSRPHGHCADDGWCCVPAPYSECTDSGVANCFTGATCSDVDTCLGPPSTTYSCESGRVCCVDIC